VTELILLPKLIKLGCDLLEKMYDGDRGVFSSSSRLYEGRLVNDFSTGSSIRYSIIVLAGLQQVEKSTGVDVRFDAKVERFLSKNWRAIGDVGDRGLLLAVLSRAGHGHVDHLLDDLEALSKDGARLRQLDVQQLSWVLLGLVSVAELGSDRATRAARRVFAVYQNYFLNHDTLLPYHVLTRWRSRFVSFGAICYFLHSWHEYARVTGDESAATVFREAARRVILGQGPRGEWAWFYDAETGTIADWYQVYSVHQASMAPLWLLPAHDAGVPGAERAIIDGFRWLAGVNELDIPMISTQPFYCYRSLRRREFSDKAIRAFRALIAVARHRDAPFARPTRVEVNRECRSYELGWLLFVWAGRSDFPTITELSILEQERSNNDG